MFRLDWSIFDWQEARRGDFFYMMRIGDEQPGETPQIPLRKLQAAIPDFDWEKGHSGVLLSSDVTDRLTELWHPDQGFVNLFADPYVN